VSGTLPTTGVDLGMLSLVALALLVAGTTLVRISRRRFSTQG
jgi:LPXTG-motif cell wall-anchored protein